MSRVSEAGTEYVLEKHDGTNIQELLVLIKSYYDSGDIVNPKYLDWQYHQNPFGRPIMYVAREKATNDVVGQYLVIPMQYVLKKNLLNGSLSLNTLTRKDFQGRGLFTKLASATYQSCLESGIKCTVGFPNPNSFPGFVKKLKFKNTGSFGFYLKALNIFGIVREKLKDRTSRRHGDEIELGHFTEAKLFDGYSIDELKIENEKENYVQFWDNVSAGYEFTTNRTYEYIKWRYLDIPTRTYKLIKLSNADGLQFIFVIRSKRMYGLSAGVLVDMFGNRSLDKAIYRAALRGISKYLRRSSITILISLSNSNAIEAKHIVYSGFFSPPDWLLPQTFPFIIRNHENSEEELADFPASYFMFGDYDVL